MRYRGFELYTGPTGTYGMLEREKSSVLTPAYETRAACKRTIDAFYEWETGMNGGKGT